jgi:peptidoglycan/xylan/chitin deacetylase (PgdA/CDA1 family)
MISLYYQTDNPLSIYGINHFIEKSGISCQINKPSPSGIIVAYGCEVPADFVISVDENVIQNTVCGKISIPDNEIPVCEIPHNTGMYEKVIADFKTDTTRFPCITKNNQGVTIGIDIFKETGYLLSGHLDSIRQSLDTTTQKEIATKPIVDLLENILFSAILDGFYQQKIPFIQKSYWPEGKKFAVCLTHDVDEIKKTYQWISRPIRYLRHRDLSGFKGQLNSFLQKIREIEPYYTYDDIIAIERELGVKSTYFILKESGKASLFSKKTWYLYGRTRSLKSAEMLGLIQRLQSNGDEIAIHGSYFSYKDSLLLNDEKKELEQLLNEDVIGTRQHNLNLVVPATWNYQIGAGLKYDTSLGFKDSIGFKWGTSFPFFPNFGKEPLQLLEIPLIIMDICLESSINKESDCLRIADAVEQHHGVLTLLWHPPMFNVLEYPDARDLYTKTNRYCQKKGAWFARARDIFEWLSNRNQHSFIYNYDTSTKICTIIPDFNEQEHFFTIYLPDYSDCDIDLENTHVIHRDGKYVYIKTNCLQKDDTIKVRFYDH